MKDQTMSEGIVFVRDYNDTYIARFRARPHPAPLGAAAEAVARKVMGNTPHFVEMCGNEYAWQIVSHNGGGEQ